MSYSRKTEISETNYVVTIPFGQLSKEMTGQNANHSLLWMPIVHYAVFTLVLNLLWPHNYLTVCETSISSATTYFQPAESVSGCLLFFPCVFCLQQTGILLVPGDDAQVFASANAKLSLLFPN